jgi:uncharacterized iron-regulated membrane protein
VAEPGLVERTVMRRKRRLLRVHRALSLVLAGWAVLQGCTGVTMMFRDQIREWQHPGLLSHHDGDVGVDAAVAAARVAVPAAVFPGAVVLPAAADGVYRVAMIVDPKTQEQRLVYVDPGTADVNAVIDPAGGFGAWASRWHTDLLQGKGTILGVKARHIVGWLGVATGLVLAIGVALWAFPRRQRWRSLRRVTSSRGAYTRLSSLHRLTGVLATPILLVIILTSTTLAFPSQARRVWYAVTPGADTGTRADGFGSTVPPPTSAPAGAGARPLSLEAQVARALDALAGGEAVSVRGGGGQPTGVVQVKVSHGWDPARGPEGAGGNATVYLDQYDGRVLRVNQPEEKTVFGQLYEYWAFAIHRGTYGGVASRGLWLVACLAPLVLLLTGLSTMGIRAGKRRRRLRRVHAALPRLTRAQVRTVAAHAVSRDVAQGVDVVQVGTPAESFYIVTQGHLDVVGPDGELLNSMGPGDHFGEVGLLGDRPRTATVRAAVPTELAVISRIGFQALLDMSELTNVDLTEVAARRAPEDPVDG